MSPIDWSKRPGWHGPVGDAIVYTPEGVGTPPPPPVLTGPGTFAEFAQAQARHTVVLVEATPGLLLMGWTKTGGRTFVWQIAVSRFTRGGASVAQLGVGLSRRVVGLRENTTALIDVADVATCDSTLSSFFWDEAAGILYAHASGGVDPDTYTVYMALVRFYFASEGIVLNRVDNQGDTGIYYQPWLEGGHDTISQQVEDILTGVKVTESAELTFTNGHEFWFPVVAGNGPYVWKNKQLRILVGGRYANGILPYSQYVSWSTLKIEDVACDEDRVTMTLKANLRATDRTLPVTPFFASSYPNLGEGVSGTKKPLIYGRVVCAPDLTDTSGNGIYTLADAAFQTLLAIHQVTAIDQLTRARTTLSLGTHYSVNLTACTVTILSPTYVWSAFDVEVDVTGKPDGGGGAIQTFSDIVRDLLTTFLGVSSTAIDDDAFSLAAAEAPQPLAVYLKDPRSLASILNTSEPGFPSLEKSVMGTVQQTLAGLWTCWIWKPGIDPAVALSLRKEDFAQFSPKPKLESVYSTARVYYGFSPAQETWQAEDRVDPKTEATCETTDVLDIYTYLTVASTARRLAQRYQLISGAVSLEVEFAERGALLATFEAGQKVLVTYDPAPDVSGSFVNMPMELIEIQRSLVPVLAIAGRLGDLRSVGAKVGSWQTVGGGGITYAAATAIQKQTWGFWTDANGYVVPGDETTHNVKTWW